MHAKTTAATLGDVAAFVSHSWSDESSTKFTRIHEWASESAASLSAHPAGMDDVLLWLDQGSPFTGRRVFQESNWEPGLIKTGRYTTLVVYTTSVTDRSTFGNRQVKYSIYAGQAGPPAGPAGRRPRWRGGSRSDQHREVRPRVKPYVGISGRTAVQDTTIPQRYQDTHGPPAGWKPNKGCEICHLR